MQLTLFDLEESYSYNYHDYILLEKNHETYNMLMNQQWSSFILYGKSGSGKTHLAHIWQKLKNAIFIDHDLINTGKGIENVISSSNAFIIENIENISNESSTLHYYNYIKENKKVLLMTSSIAPRFLNYKIKDLKSRMLYTMNAKLANPDEELLKIMLIKLFVDRQIHIELKVINYILNNTERSFQSLSNIVKCIYRELPYYNNGVTIPFVKSIIGKNEPIQRKSINYSRI
ncbi:chromosomal DNA replication initiator-like protein [Ehrlichia ruminantium]|uniref:Chromosomal DNA replication initiator-like protein n=1 Tax=Ehrlichia ruminantium TaxID=779 RepID=A0A170TYV3_EHRRU|nr:DnaA/Hda family protein [Ehrlichia ruminantium]GAT77022.1 chromosomal DNA replication initiator-like protein [Ehrlichia ruminantium]GAT78064.1 chromosomal DNA replication initiator-like protein [Ehrlichia ruminantium]GAT79220.1 chromosomal DNA replication initiator-like protein [Ehrlichia ruminantium]